MLNFGSFSFCNRRRAWTSDFWLLISLAPDLEAQSTKARRHEGTKVRRLEVGNTEELLLSHTVYRTTFNFQWLIRLIPISIPFTDQTYEKKSSNPQNTSSRAQGIPGNPFLHPIRKKSKGGWFWFEGHNSWVWRNIEILNIDWCLIPLLGKLVLTTLSRFVYNEQNLAPVRGGTTSDAELFLGLCFPRTPVRNHFLGRRS